MQRTIMFLFFILTPLPALAFPVVTGSLTQSLLFLLFAGVGVTGYTAKRSRKMLVGCLIAFLVVLTYIISLNVAVNALSMKAVKFPSEHPTTSASTPPIIDILTASKLVKSHGFVPLQVADKPMPYIKGMNTFSPKYWKDAQDYALERNANGVILFSNYISPAFNLAQHLNAFSNNVFVVSTSKGTTYVDEKISSHAYIDEFFSNSTLNNINITNFPSHDVYEKKLYLLNKTKALELSNYNLIVAGGDDLLNTYLSYNSKALTIPSMLLMQDNEWSNLSNSLDKHKPTILAFTDPLSNQHKKTLASFALQQLRKHMEINNLGYMLTSDFVSVLPPMPTDNYITPYHYNADRHMTATTLYATQRHHGEITTLCFSDNCTERLPPQSSSFNTTLIDINKVFDFKNYTLTVDTDGIDATKPIAIILEDASTSLLGYFLAHQLVENGYHFSGFANLYGGLFGGTYMNPLAKGTDAEFYYDDIRIRIDTAIQELLLATTPNKPLQLSSRWLIAAGVLLGLLISIQSLPKYIRYTSFAATLYISLYGSLWVQAPIHEYQFLITTNLALTVLFAVIATFYPEDTLPLKHKTLLFIANTVTFFFLITLAVTPPIDRFYWGLGWAILLVISLRIGSKSNVSVCGEKYRATVPHIKGFKGYIVSHGERLSWYKLLLAKEWIIRSNHLCPSESKTGGLFHSYVAKRRKINAVIARMELMEDPSGQLASAGHKKLQFWVMPYRNYTKSGCAESHYSGYSLDFAYAYGDQLAVTEGHSSEFKLGNRNTPANRLEKNILKALRKAEERMGDPVSIEFGMTATGSVDILQVRKQPIHPSADESSLRLWRDFHHKTKLVDNTHLTPLSQSVLHHLYNKEIILSEGGIFRAVKPCTRFDLNVISQSLENLKEIAQDKDLIESGSLRRLVETIAEQIKPAVQMETTQAQIFNEEIFNVMSECATFCQNIGGFPESFELTDSNTMAPVVQVTATKRDAVRYIVLTGIALIKKSPHKKVFGQNISLSGLERGIQYSSIPILPNKDTQEIVVVAGEMPPERIKIDDIQKYPEAQLNRYTLECLTLPMSLMYLVPKFGGIICHSGTPLSHLAITAKHYKTPLVIKKRD